MRMVERIANAGLRREMNDALGLLLGKGRLDRRPVGQIGLDEAKGLKRLEPREPGFLQRQVVIGAEIVEPDHLVPALEQTGRRVIPNEAGGAGEQDSHRPLSSPPCLSSKTATGEPLGPAYVNAIGLTAPRGAV